MLPRRLRGLQEGVLVLEGGILAAEGVAWGQERMGTAGSEEGVVQEVVETLVKGLFQLESGEEVRDYLKDLEGGVGVTAEEDLAEAEADIEEFKSNNTISKVHTSSTRRVGGRMRFVTYSS